MNPIESLEQRTDEELAIMIANWGNCLPGGYSLADWEEAMVMAKSNRQSTRPLVDIAYQLLIIKRRYQDAESRSVITSTDHSPTQTER